MTDVLVDGYHWYRNEAGGWRQRGSGVPQFPSPREVALLDEIERLRINYAHACEEADVWMAEAKKLQALIDALAAVNRPYVGTDDWWAAIDALLATSTIPGT